MNIRDACEKDLPKLESIYQYYVETSIATFEEKNDRSTDMNELFKSVKQRDLPFIVATDTTDEDQIIGYAYAKPYHTRSAYRFAVEDSIYIRNDRHGMGAGRKLLKSLLDKLRATPIRQVISAMSIKPEEQEEHVPTCRLHRKLGFRPVGRLTSVGLKFNTWIDVVLYQLDLDNGPSTTVEA